MKPKTRHQPRLGRGILRLPSSASLHPQLRRVIEGEANHFKCSMSFVIVTALADVFGIEVTRYDTPVKNGRP